MIVWVRLRSIVLTWQTYVLIKNGILRTFLLISFLKFKTSWPNLIQPHQNMDLIEEQMALKYCQEVWCNCQQQKGIVLHYLLLDLYFISNLQFQKTFWELNSD